MKRFSIAAPLVLGLSVGVVSCQRDAQPGVSNAGAGVSNSPAAASSQQPAPPQTQLKVGDRAPDFALTDTEGQTVKLSDFRGKKNVVLAFYVLAFTGG
jgi:cytochrome oxidase Cu insertion factor (SCO1/SenC/PrrC family)